MSRHLITGGTGFIGCRLISALNGEIVALSRKKISGYKTIICDLQHSTIPGNSLKGINVVFHLAGFAHDLRNATSIQNLYQKVNVDATIRLANLAVKSNVKKVCICQ